MVPASFSARNAYPHSSRLLYTLFSFASQSAPRFFRSKPHHDAGNVLAKRESEGFDPHEKLDIVFAVLIPALVLLSGLFAGLTLGYMSLDETQLNVLSISGTPYVYQSFQQMVPNPLKIQQKTARIRKQDKADSEEWSSSAGHPPSCKHDCQRVSSSYHRPCTGWRLPKRCYQHSTHCYVSSLPTAINIFSRPTLSVPIHCIDIICHGGLDLIVQTSPLLRRTGERGTVR